MLRISMFKEELRANTPTTCAACHGSIGANSTVVVVGVGFPQIYLHRACVDSAIEKSYERYNNDAKFDKIRSSELQGEGLLAKLERNSVGVET